MATNNSFSPIGIFDSGLGGLSILNEINKRLPKERLIYFADSKNAPYGEKPAEDIVNISKRNTDFLISKGCKLVVVACNTATTNAISLLRQTYNVPFVGIEPAIKPAAFKSKNSKVGVLATKGTLSSELFMKTAQKFTRHTKVVEVVGKGIVEAIENNTLNTEAFRRVLEEQLNPFVEADIDTLVLGCSHYPFISHLIQMVLGPDVNIIDSGYAAAKQTERILHSKDLLNTKHLEAKNKVTIYANGTSKLAFEGILKQLEISDYKYIDL